MVAHFAIPSPPLSPIPPSPAPLRLVKKVDAGSGVERNTEVLKESAVARVVNLTEEHGDGDDDDDDDDDDDNDDDDDDDDNDNNGHEKSCLNNIDLSNFDAENNKVNQLERDARGKVPRLEEEECFDVKNHPSPTAKEPDISYNCDADSCHSNLESKGDSMLHSDRDNNLEKSNHFESRISLGLNMVEMTGKVVDSILGVVSSDESDSDIDLSGVQSDAFDDEDYSSFDSNNSRFDFVSDSGSHHDDNNGEGNESGVNRNEPSLKNAEVKQIGQASNLAVGPDQRSEENATFEGDKSTCALGDEQESPAKDEAMNSPEIGGLNSEDEDVTEKVDPVSSENEDVISKQDKSKEKDSSKCDTSSTCMIDNPEEQSFLRISDDMNSKQEKMKEKDLPHCDASNACMAENTEEHSFLETSDDTSPKSCKVNSHSCTVSYRAEEDKQKGINESSGVQSSDFDKCVEKAKKRLTNATDHLQLASGSVCKRSRTGDNNTPSWIELTEVNKSQSGNICTASKKIIETCVEGDTGCVPGVDKLNAKDEFLSAKSSGMEEDSINDKDTAESRIECFGTTIVDKKEIENCVNTDKVSVKADLETAGLHENRSTVSKSSHEEIACNSKFYVDGVSGISKVILRDQDSVQKGMSGSGSGSAASGEGLGGAGRLGGASLGGGETLQGGVSLDDSGSPPGGASLDSGGDLDGIGSLDDAGNLDPMTGPTGSALVREEKSRRLNTTEKEKGEKFDISKDQQKQVLNNHLTASNGTNISDGANVKGLEDKADKTETIHPDKLTGSHQSSSNLTMGDNELASRHWLESSDQPVVAQTGSVTMQSASTDTMLPLSAMEGADIELCLDSIISEETDHFPQISPLPPSPGGQRPRSISPLPITPLPGSLSPLISPSQFASPPSLRGNRIDSDRLLCIAKPLAILSSDSVRMLDFLSQDEEDLELESVYDNRMKNDGKPIDFSSSSFAFVSVQNDSSEKQKTSYDETSPYKKDEKVSSQTKSGRTSHPPSPSLADSEEKRPVCVAACKRNGRDGVEMNDPGEKDKSAKIAGAHEIPRNMSDDSSSEMDIMVASNTAENYTEHQGGSSRVSSPKRALRKRKMVETGKVRTLRSSDKRLNNEGSLVAVNSHLNDGKKARKSVEKGVPGHGGEIGNNQEIKEGKRSLRSNTKIVDVEKEHVRRIKGKNAKRFECKNGNIKEIQERDPQGENVVMRSIEEKSDMSRSSSNGGGLITDKSGKKDVKNHTRKNDTFEPKIAAGPSSSRDNVVVKASECTTLTSKKFDEAKGQSVRALDDVVGRRQDLDVIDEISAVRPKFLETEEIEPKTVMQRLTCRDHKQTEVHYAESCIKFLRDRESLEGVVRQFSSIKNISSATSIVSAIVSYMKTNKTDNLSNVFRILHQIEASFVDSRLLQNELVGRFTQRPEVLEKELLIAEVVEECSKVPHLIALVKRILHFLPKAILREDKGSDESILSLW